MMSFERVGNLYFLEICYSNLVGAEHLFVMANQKLVATYHFPFLVEKCSY